MCYVIKIELSKSSISKHSWDCDHSFNFQNIKILHSNHPFEFDFLKNVAIYFHCKVIVNENLTPKSCLIYGKIYLVLIISFFCSLLFFSLLIPPTFYVYEFILIAISLSYLFFFLIAFFILSFLSASLFLFLKNLLPLFWLLLPTPLLIFCFLFSHCLFFTSLASTPSWLPSFLMVLINSGFCLLGGSMSICT